MSEKRKRYTPTEKAKIALEAIKEEQTLAQISSRYGVHASQINAWKKQLFAHLPDAFSDKAKRTQKAHQDKLTTIYDQIVCLKLKNDFLKKSLSYSVAERRQWVETSHPMLSVRQQARLLNLQRSGVYYQPKQAILSDGQLCLLRRVYEAYTQYPYMGTRQMCDYLCSHQYPCKRHAIRWAYEKLGLRALAPGLHTSRPHPQHKIYPYLLKDKVIQQPCDVFSTDITYIPNTFEFAKN